MNVADVGERALIERIRRRIPPAPAFVIVGIGDDAAVVEPERNLLEVLTTDCQVEGVHFDQTFVGAADIGHKALAVNLSDLAAMGAAPRVALLSLVLPPALPVASVDALVDGMTALAARARISIVGGNIARSPGPLVVDVTATGSVHSRRVLTRGGARAGDDLYVTGSLGGAALGLAHACDRTRRARDRRSIGTGGRSRGHVLDCCSAAIARRARASISVMALPTESGKSARPADSARSSRPTSCPSSRDRRCAMPSVEAKITNSCLRYRPECARD